MIALDRTRLTGRSPHALRAGFKGVPEGTPDELRREDAPEEPRKTLRFYISGAIRAYTEAPCLNHCIKITRQTADW
jgi:hypothetical protein